jgi:hypothetical protein
MAIVQLHPMFVSLSGNLGGLVHANRYGSQYVRRLVIPFNPDTPQQRLCRKSFAEAVASWQGLAPYKQAQWNAKARLRKRNGYNLFIAEFLRKKYSSSDYIINRESSGNTSFASSPSSSIIHNSSSPKQQLRCHSVMGNAEPLGMLLVQGSPGW